MGHAADRLSFPDGEIICWAFASKPCNGFDSKKVQICQDRSTHIPQIAKLAMHMAQRIQFGAGTRLLLKSTIVEKDSAAPPVIRDLVQ
jgi:hypothetical protein